MGEGLRTALAREFHDWQQLGRGMTTWDKPVVPEPNFHPFFAHGALVDRPPLEDNGRHETWLSKLSSHLKAAFGSDSEPPVEIPLSEPGFLEPFRTGEAPDYLLDGREDLFHASWILPSDIAWNPKEWEPLLFSLSSGAFPVCLEITATGGRIHLQWIVDERDRDVLTDSIHAVEMAIQPSTDILLEWLADHDPGSCWSGDLALKDDFLFTLRNEFRSDPYETIFSALSRLASCELGVVQIVFTPCGNPWAESIWRSVIDENGRPFFSGGQGHLQAAKEKCGAPLFAACIRLAVLSEEESADEAADRLLRPFGCFDEANGFTLAPQSGPEDDEWLGDLLNRRFRRSGMILNAREMFALVHPPSARVGAGALQRMVTNTRHAPLQHTAGSGLLLGTNEHAGESRECHIDPDERSRHMHVLGASGTGKSTFLLNSMLQDLEGGNGFALLDPHGDLVEAVLDRLPAHRINDVVIFNPADTEFPVGFNILRAHTDVEKNLLASDFVAIFERLSSSWGDQMSAVLGNAALALLESERGGTLIDLKRFLIEKGFRENYLHSVTDPEVVYFWRHEFPLLRGTTQGSLLTRLSGFLRHRLIRNMVSQKGERFDVARMMDEGKIILAPLSQGLIGQENSWLLGSLLVSRFYQAALSRQSQGEQNRRPFYLYLDEAHNFVTPSIASILSGTRKYGLGLVLAHQELDQFPSRESGILSSILTNCHTRVCFRLGDHDAARLETGFTHFEADDLRRLGVGEAVCRIGGSDNDFNIRTSPSPSKSADFKEQREKAIHHSRSTYATPREQVEQASNNYPVPEPTTGKAPVNRRPPNADRKPAIPTTPAEEPHSIPVEIPPPDEPQASEPEVVEAAAPPSSAPPILPAVEKPRTPGRGGSHHKHLQKVIKAHGNGLGLRATIEAELPDRAGCIDVLLEKTNTRIAFEIAEKSPLEQEVRNIQKCLEAGIGEIYVVSTESAHLAKIRAAADTSIGAENLAGVEFVESSGLGEVFAKIGARLAGSETTNRGFRVKVTYNPLAKQRGETSTREIHRAVTDHMDTRKGSGSGGGNPSGS